MKDFIGEHLISITTPGDGDCEGNEMILEFESGFLCIRAIDKSSRGCVGLCWEEV